LAIALMRYAPASTFLNEKRPDASVVTTGFGAGLFAVGAGAVDAAMRGARVTTPPALDTTVPAGAAAGAAPEV
jgi:hypothetical protein